MLSAIAAFVPQWSVFAVDNVVGDFKGTSTQLVLLLEKCAV